ncbi:ELWxxDGT repeat protein [Archangium violaceum]|uniref:ELWxxDGT repeat protein n=1 Tax=Archangium violaceum TaxID=83451 RepID=UPI0006961BF1|nr:ELWxxDGT repeat protein [Archangium violaceum]
MRSSCPRARLVEDINEGLEPSSIANLKDVNGKLFFTADDGEHGVELWKSDGTRGGTRLVKDITPGAAGSAIRELTEVNGKVFFAVGAELWKSDGTERGTVRLATFAVEFADFFPRNLFEYRGKLVFEGFDEEHGTEPWVSDGTSRGTRLLLDFNPGPEGSGPSDFVELDGDLVFEVFDEAALTVKLVKLEDWRRVVELVDLGDESSVRKTLVVGHRLFIYYTDEGDPTIAVTTGRPGTFRDLFRTRRFGATGVRDLLALEGKVYFQVGSALWVTDGTEAGTRLVKDVLPDSGVDKVLLFLTVLSNRLYFSADDGVAGRELWISDGTESGTRLFADLNPGPASSSPTDLLNVHNSKLFFAADDGVHGREPWKLHRGGTPELLMDIAPGMASSSPRGFIRSDEDIFFAADDGRGGEELWATPKEHNDCHR